MTQRTNYVLIDYENVQPNDLALLQHGRFVVKVFVGPNQSRVPVELAVAMQPLGANCEYVRLDTAGKNALDFHVAYHLGVLSANDPEGFFHVVSKDTGFDPLIKHLKSRKIFAHRSSGIAEMPCHKPALPPTIDKRVEVAVADLVRRKASKPRTGKTLRSTLHALFKKELPEEQLDALFAALCQRGFVKLQGDRLTYELPAEASSH